MPEWFSSTVLNYNSIVHHTIFGMHKAKEVIGKPNKGHFTILPTSEVVLIFQGFQHLYVCLTDYNNKCTQKWMLMHHKSYQKYLKILFDREHI